jgi:hypothetical protein
MAMVRIEIAAIINIHPISRGAGLQPYQPRNLATQMEPSQWICRSCGAEFETRGKRDAHHRKVHRVTGPRSQSTVKNARMRRSTGGKFVCQCNREYESVQALLKHKKRCFVEEMMDIDEDDGVEGKYPLISKDWVKSDERKDFKSRLG